MFREIVEMSLRRRYNDKIIKNETSIKVRKV